MQLTGRHRTTATALLASSFAFSLAGLGVGGGGGPSFLSSTALLSTLLVYTKSHEIGRYLAQWLVLTLSITLSHSRASLSALSSPSMSLLMLVLLSSTSAFLALLPVYLTHAVPPNLRLHNHNHRLLVFPTFWTLTWLVVSRASPIGRLLTWTPLTGIESYEWILPILGLPALDFISALWASTAAEYIAVIGLSEDGSSKDEVLLPGVPSNTESDAVIAHTTVYKRLVPSLTLLLALTIPSFTARSLPPPPHSDAANITPLSVACILPPPLPSSSSVSPLQHFIDETKKHTARARVLLWPEGAVTFESEAAKQDALSKFREELYYNGHVWVGVSFLQRISGDQNTGGRDGMYRNGLMLLGPDGSAAEFTYYKRNLVPIAESFHQLASSTPPPLHVIDLPKAVGSETRPVTLTSSICLDFSSPLFPSNPDIPIPGHGDDPHRPSLILAPARTWDTRVGETMYALARLRAKEVGAELLWCDGGAGGLSGVGPDVQLGWGSWSKTIGIPNELDNSGHKRTIYATYGDFAVLVFVLGVWGAAVAVVSVNGPVTERIGRLGIINGNASIGVGQARDWVGRSVMGLWDRVRGRIAGTRPAPLLIQIDEEEEERFI